MTEIVPLPDIEQTKVDAALHGGVLSIGNFDGIHQGHIELLWQTQQMAERIGGPSIACVFDPHPIAILRPDAEPKRLTSIEERARRLNRSKIDFLVVCQTSQELLDYTAEDFFQSLVIDNLRCRGMVEGENFCFGKDRRGDVDLLRRLCDGRDLHFETAAMQNSDGETISSTRIRESILAGDVYDACQMMSAFHRVTGTVVHGDARGRTIGFPTANLSGIDVVIPAPGVYAALATVDNMTYDAAIHIGESPTFQADTLANSKPIY